MLSQVSNLTYACLGAYTTPRTILLIDYRLQVRRLDL